MPKSKRRRKNGIEKCLHRMSHEKRMLIEEYMLSATKEKKEWMENMVKKQDEVKRKIYKMLGIYTRIRNHITKYVASELDKKIENLKRERDNTVTLAIQKSTKLKKLETERKKSTEEYDKVWNQINRKTKGIQKHWSTL